MHFELTRLHEWQFPTLAATRARGMDLLRPLRVRCPGCGLEYMAGLAEAVDAGERAAVVDYVTGQLAGECPDHPARFAVE